MNTKQYPHTAEQRLERAVYVLNQIAPGHPGYEGQSALVAEIRAEVESSCDGCKGSGADFGNDPNRQPVECTSCNGRGK